MMTRAKEEELASAGDDNDGFEESGRSDQIPWTVWEMKKWGKYIKAGSSGDTGEEDRMVERQSDGESWQPNGKSNEMTSGGKETQSKTEKKMGWWFLKYVEVWCII